MVGALAGLNASYSSCNQPSGYTITILVLEICAAFQDRMLSEFTWRETTSAAGESWSGLGNSSLPRPRSIKVNGAVAMRACAAGWHFNQNFPGRRARLEGPAMVYTGFTRPHHGANGLQRI